MFPGATLQPGLSAGFAGALLNLLLANPHLGAQVMCRMLREAMREVRGVLEAGRWGWERVQGVQPALEAMMVLCVVAEAA